MEKQGLWPAILRFARNVCIIAVCIFVLAGLSCLPAAWRTFYHLGNRAMLLGVLALVVSAASSVGKAAVAGYPLRQPLTERNTYQRIKQGLADSMATYRFAITMGIAGGVAIVLGDLIRRAGLSALGLQ